MRPRHVLRLAVLVVAAFALSAGAALAAGPNDPCDPDLKRLCPDVAPGGGNLLRCLREHQDEVAPACRAEMERRKGRRSARGAELRAACGGEVARVCGDVDPDDGGLARCLRERADQISPGCRQAAAKKQAR